MESNELWKIIEILNTNDEIRQLMVLSLFMSDKLIYEVIRILKDHDARLVS